MAISSAPIRRRIAVVFATPIGVGAVCTFLTLTTIARQSLALSTPRFCRIRACTGFGHTNLWQLASSRYDYDDNDDGPYRGRRYSSRGGSTSSRSDSYGGETRRRRRNGSSRDSGEHDSYSGSKYRQRNSSGRSNNTGRNRYAPDGRKKQQRGERINNAKEQQQSERPPVPPLDTRPFYFTCRHTYETSLRSELVRSLGDRERISFQKPHPGLVMVTTDDQDIVHKLSNLNPTYALQVLPDCVLVEAESIKGLARAVVHKALSVPIENDQDDSIQGLLLPQLVAAPKGSLSIHALVPEMGRGMPRAQLPQYRRITKVGEEIAAQLQKRCKAARADENNNNREQWLLQILLLEPSIVAASFSRCHHDAAIPEASVNWTWPNWRLPAGLALVELDEKQQALVPSSAYRKLLEAFWYLRDRPPIDGDYPVVDLGASPGGWTGALRLMGCKVLSVDRSPLAPALMNDDGVRFVKGDAFRFVPPWVPEELNKLEEPLPHTWMVSDIIAYPDKIKSLLDEWCGNHWVSHAIVTIKFQSEIAWEDMEGATQIIKNHGYSCKTVHFFNNKNEVTLLAVKEGYTNNCYNDDDLLGIPMYAPTLPKAKKA